MSIRLSHQLFAERGDEWNTPNPQHDAGITIRHRRWPDGSLRDVEVEYDVEGYDRPVAPYAKPTCRDPGPITTDRSARLQCRRKVQVRPPEYRCIVPVAPVLPQDVKLPTAEDLARGKRQKAAVKARLTRAANRIKREEQARAQVQDQLLVKILTVKGLFDA